MFTKLFAVCIIAWFYQSAGKIGENKIQWAVIGLIGYIIFVALSYIFIAKPLLAIFLNKAMWISATLGHIPAVVGVLAAVFIRRRLISSATKSSAVGE